MRPCFPLAFLTAITLFVPHAASAQDAKSGGQEGWVIQVEDEEILVDLGTTHGLHEGDPITVYSVVSLTHPITKKHVADRLYLGTDAVKRAGKAVSLVRLEGVPKGKVKVGDVVVALGNKGIALPAAPGTAPPAVQCGPCATDAPAMEVHKTWLSTVGKPVEDRLAAWKAFFDANPDNPYWKDVVSEVTWLERLAGDRAGATAAAGAARPRGMVAVHNAPREVEAGAPLAPAVSVLAEVPIDRVSLLYRPAGSDLYREVVMRPAGDTAFVGEIPAADVRAGRLEYYVEALDRGGNRVAVFRGSDKPWPVVVAAPRGGLREVVRRSQVRASGEYVDFYSSAWGTDAFWKTEVDFTYRLQWDPIRFHSFRMGFGIFEGKGGPARYIEDPGGYQKTYGTPFKPYRRVISYTYFEPEFAITPYLHLIPRLVLGGIGEYDKPGYKGDRRGEGIFGVHGYLRIGRETGTNLLVGGSFTQEMGVEGLVEMNIALIRFIPMGLSVSATNFPVNENYGARLMAVIGWRQFDWMSVVARVGVNMRNIRHAGVGFGGGLAFNW